MEDAELTSKKPNEKRYLPFLWIILTCAAAHLWCLGSQFYMDDMPGIRDSGLVRSGNLGGLHSLSWTNFWYVVIYRIFGMSSVAYHAGNWLLHTAVACTLFAFGKDFLKEKCPTGVALFGALLFAVHPLASEIPNYARTQDLAWVTLFSLLAAWAMLRFLRDGGVIKLVFCVLAVVGALLSKGPGLFHALMAVAVVGLACMRPEHWSFVKRRWIIVVGLTAVLIGALWLTGIPSRWLAFTFRWQEPRFIGHAYTLSRVFWEFAWRAVIPVALSSDHGITETLIPPGTHFWNIPDKGAMLAMACFLTLTGFSVFLACRKSTRLIGVCLFLFAATILFRFLYLIPEFMPEYRIYPGLPWFCLGAAIVLAGAWRWMFKTVSPRVPAVILLGGLAFLSARRSFVWHDLDRLTADVLKRYPARARALWELNDRDMDAGNWQAVIDRQTTMWPEIERQFVEGNKRLAPAREIPSGDFVLAMVAIHGHYARALAHTQSPMVGLSVMAQLEAHMKQMQMTVENKPLEWGYFYHDKALILEMTGNYAAAAELLRQKCLPGFWPEDLKRVEKELAAKPGS